MQYRVHVLYLQLKYFQSQCLMEIVKLLNCQLLIFVFTKKLSNQSIINTTCGSCPADKNTVCKYCTCTLLSISYQSLCQQDEDS